MNLLNNSYKIVFADLDDTLIYTYTGNTFPQGIWDFMFNFDVLDNIINLKPDYLFIVSNQAGIGTYVDHSVFRIKFDYIVTAIKDYTAIKTVDGLYCISNDKSNKCRKPNTGMLENLLTRYNLNDINKSEMVMIGDAAGHPDDFSDSDKKCAENFGIDFIYAKEDKFIKL